MPHKDTKEVKSHFYGDSCKPPHRCPEGTCKKDYGNTCKVCNLDMPAPIKHTEENCQACKEDWVNDFRKVGEGSVRFMATREEVII